MSNPPVAPMDSQAIRASEARLGLLKVDGLGLTPRLHKLNPQKTAEAVLKYWPNLSAAALSIGVSASLLHWHKAHSPWFQNIVREADAKGCDALETVLFNRGVSGEEYTFTDRIAYLRAHRPELYDRAKTIRVEGLSLTNKEASARASLAEQAIDGEIVGNYKRRKLVKRVGRGDAGDKPK